MLAWLYLLGAVLAFGTASLLQAKGARRSDASRTGLAFFLDLANSGPYAAGTALDLFAVVLTALALRELPLFLVQGATASSLVVTALGAALLFPAERRAGLWRPVVAVSLGLALLGASAAGGASTRLSLVALLVLSAGLPAILGARLMLARTILRRSLQYAVLAGLSYAGMGISLRSLHVPSNVLGTAALPAAWMAAGYLTMALIFFGRALQLGAVTECMAIVVSIDTLLPAGIGVWLLGDRARPGGAATALLGLATTLAAVLWLIRTTNEPAAGAAPQPAARTLV